jgi:hypothetical protein
VISINRTRRYPKRVLKRRALRIEMAGTSPAMTIPFERSAVEGIVMGQAKALLECT